MYKFLEHTADVKFIAEGNSLEEAFLEASKALKEAICGDIKVLEQQTKEIEIEGDNLESLLYNFLEEFIVLLESEDFLISKITEIKIDQKNFILKAKVSGDKIDNYKFTNDVKAVTYNEMFVKNEKGKWRLQVVLDV
ncbi:Protein archease [uncultured archaeon]|nr:Protein archease [uncultured archaeon]